MEKKDYFYLPVILILLGAGLFQTCHYSKENREYRRNIKDLEATNKRNQISIDSLKASVSERDKRDSVLVMEIQSLHITTTNADHTTILNMPADSFLMLLSGYIDSSAGNIPR